jgi:hypothetical protein
MSSTRGSAILRLPSFHSRNFSREYLSSYHARSSIIILPHHLSIQSIRYLASFSKRKRAVEKWLIQYQVEPEPKCVINDTTFVAHLIARDFRIRK